MFLDYKIAHSEDYECTESLDDFSPADALHATFTNHDICYQAGGRTIQRPLGFYQHYRDCRSTGNDGNG